uniref:RegA n=1 Tax=Pandorina morum TaxID=33099 RepID=A0A1W5IXE9_PANMO|nr:regA [Pandorina morum]
MEAEPGEEANEGTVAQAPKQALPRQQQQQQQQQQAPLQQQSQDPQQEQHQPQQLQPYQQQRQQQSQQHQYQHQQPATTASPTRRPPPAVEPPAAEPMPRVMSIAQAQQAQQAGGGGGHLATRPPGAFPTLPAWSVTPPGIPLALRPLNLAPFAMRDSSPHGPAPVPRRVHNPHDGDDSGDDKDGMDLCEPGLAGSGALPSTVPRPPQRRGFVGGGRGVSAADADAGSPEEPPTVLQTSTGQPLLLRSVRSMVNSRAAELDPAGDLAARWLPHHCEAQPLPHVAPPQLPPLPPRQHHQHQQQPPHQQGPYGHYGGTDAGERVRRLAAAGSDPESGRWSAEPQPGYHPPYPGMPGVPAGLPVGTPDAHLHPHQHQYPSYNRTRMLQPPLPAPPPPPSLRPLARDSGLLRLPSGYPAPAHMDAGGAGAGAGAGAGGSGDYGAMDLADIPTTELPEGPIEVTVAVRVGSSGTRRARGGGGRSADEDSRSGYMRGAATGMFDVPRYLAGRDCIHNGTRWMSRSNFEKVGGSKMAKWYRSIRVLPDLEPLGEWLERHHLPVTKGPARRSRKRPNIGDSGDEQASGAGQDPAEGADATGSPEPAGLSPRGLPGAPPATAGAAATTASSAPATEPLGTSSNTGPGDGPGGGAFATAAEAAAAAAFGGARQPGRGGSSGGGAEPLPVERSLPPYVSRLGAPSEERFLQRLLNTLSPSQSAPLPLPRQAQPPPHEKYSAALPSHPASVAAAVNNTAAADDAAAAAESYEPSDRTGRAQAPQAAGAGAATAPFAGAGGPLGRPTPDADTSSATELAALRWRVLRPQHRSAEPGDLDPPESPPRAPRPAGHPGQWCGPSLEPRGQEHSWRRHDSGGLQQRLGPGSARPAYGESLPYTHTAEDAGEEGQREHGGFAVSGLALEIRRPLAGARRPSGQIQEHMEEERQPRPRRLPAGDGGSGSSARPQPVPTEWAWRTEERHEQTDEANEHLQGDREPRGSGGVYRSHHYQPAARRSDDSPPPPPPREPPYKWNPYPAAEAPSRLACYRGLQLPAGAVAAAAAVELRDSLREPRPEPGGDDDAYERREYYSDRDPPFQRMQRRRIDSAGTAADTHHDIRAGQSGGGGGYAHQQQHRAAAAGLDDYPTRRRALQQTRAPPLDHNDNDNDDDDGGGGGGDDERRPQWQAPNPYSQPGGGPPSPPRWRHQQGHQLQPHRSSPPRYEHTGYGYGYQLGVAYDDRDHPARRPQPAPAQARPQKTSGARMRDVREETSQ